MVTQVQRKMTFVSRPYRQRIGLIPMTIAIMFAWTVVAVGFAVSTVAMQPAALWGQLMLLAVCAFAVYMVFVTYVWIKEGQQHYELVIDGYLITLLSYNKQQESSISQQISLDDVISAEYCEPRDMSSLLLKGHSTSLELPLWSFGPEAESKIISWVKGNGVEIIGIPNPVTN